MMRYQVDQESLGVLLADLLNELQILVVHLEVHGDRTRQK
jgi:hypothetical protein